jgi:hypothetical protein
MGNSWTSEFSRTARSSFQIAEHRFDIDGRSAVDRFDRPDPQAIPDDFSHRYRMEP